MKRVKVTIAAAIAAIIVAGACAPKATTVDFSNVPDTEKCRHMKDVCKEAQIFAGQYDGMSSEEKKDAKAVLNAYIQQCEGAQELCKKSAE